MKEQTGTRMLAAITGASSGIGFELAQVFAKDGYDLMIVAEDDGIFRAKSALETAGSNVQAFRIDLASPNGVEEFYQKLDGQPRDIDAIAINAGVGVAGDFATVTEWKDELNLINLNVVSTVHLTKLIAKKMLRQKKGKILLTSSVVSQTPNPFMACYAASKAFIQSFAMAIRNELSDSPLTITSLMPGATETNFFHRAKMEGTPVGEAKKTDAATVAQDGFDALMAGKDHVISASMKEKIGVGIMGHVPETMNASMARKQSEPPTKPRH